MSNIDIEYKLVNDVIAEVDVTTGEAGVVIEYLNRHGWIRTPHEAKATARDEVPGRTITESELNRALVASWDDGTEYDFYAVAKHLGITVVPDPKPTNTEKWETFCKQIGIDLKPWQIDYLVAAMDERGVKAPGGENDD